MVTLKSLTDQLLKAFWYNLFIFPVLAAFYVPWNLWWLQYTPLQLLKWLATAGIASAAINFVLRPYNAWVSKFIEKRFAKKLFVVTGPNEEGVFELKMADESFGFCDDCPECNHDGCVFHEESRKSLNNTDDNSRVDEA